MPDFTEFAPDFPREVWSERDRRYLAPFFGNADGVISAMRNFPPELEGALCSRASRADGSLLRVFLRDYVYPIVEGRDREAAAEFEAMVDFFHHHNNARFAEKARKFYVKWFAQFGDESIAQMTGINVIILAASQVLIKFVEDQRIGLEPIEKSTRYVDYGAKPYAYYVPLPDLRRLGLEGEYRASMDRLFDVYVALRAPLLAWLKANFEADDNVLEKKAFDTLRGLLPMATMSQLALRGNGAAWGYLINRTAQQNLGELAWFSETLRGELEREIPSLLLRLDDPKTLSYQKQLAGRKHRVRELLEQYSWSQKLESSLGPTVRLVEHDPEGENRVIARILQKETDLTFDSVFRLVRDFSEEQKRLVLQSYFTGRTGRWEKVGRALEYAGLEFEIEMNIGGYRDLHRHRMLTQDRQYFTTRLGYDVPKEILESGLADQYSEVLESVRPLYEKLREDSKDLAQYVVPLAYRIRFSQRMNMREAFWEGELRTGPQGHPDYRTIEQEKVRKIREAYPLLAEYMLVDLNDYPIARRESEVNIARKEARLIERFGL